MQQNVATAATLGSLNNYVDKMRWVGGSKISIFDHAHGLKCPSRCRQVVKKGKILATQLLNDPFTWRMLTNIVLHGDGIETIDRQAVLWYIYGHSIFVYYVPMYYIHSMYSMYQGRSQSSSHPIIIIFRWILNIILKHVNLNNNYLKYTIRGWDKYNLIKGRINIQLAKDNI